MKLVVIEGVKTLQLDLTTTGALALLLLTLGNFIRKRLPIFQRMTIPSSVIGGFICAITVLLLRTSKLLYIDMDTTLQLPFMLAFFTCVGFGGSFKMLKAGGRLLAVYLFSTWILAIIQNLVGAGLAKSLGINPLLGIMAGTVSLVGGHGNAAAFGPIAESAGAQGASAVALAAATYGLIVGSLLGGPIGDWLLKKNKVEVTPDAEKINNVESETDNTQTEEKITKITSTNFLAHLTIVFVFMAGGILFSELIGLLQIKNFAIPNYVGAMFLAIIFRNVNDKNKIFHMEQPIVDLILDVGLGMFLTMAIMTLKIWELAELAGPLIIILLVQTVVLFIFVILFVFPLLRGKKDSENAYDAGVLSGGFMGWGLGIAATAVVCMSAIVEKYRKASPKAFLIAPLCGAVFVDIVAIPTIIFFIGLFS
ncbi:sodium/glutamate symporter [Vagococcus sp.]|uniref:sodium/glutamate symporter n=1 Tax=Vagococcus sp. TaxID=1933889 RepID=UPI003F9BB1C3